MQHTNQRKRASLILGAVVLAAGSVVLHGCNGDDNNGGPGTPGATSNATTGATAGATVRATAGATVRATTGATAGATTGATAGATSSGTANPTATLRL